MSFFESNKSKVVIDGQAISQNIELLAGKLSKECRLMPVIKSDAYGHGILETARLLVEKDVWGFGIYEMEEAALLRQSGIKKPLFMLSGLLGDDSTKAHEFDLTLGVVSLDELGKINSRAKAFGKKVRVHLKADTGMSRFGMKAEEIFHAVNNRHDFDFVDFEGLYSHFACADEPEHEANRQQLELFRQILSQVRLTGWKPKFVHMANSSAIMSMKESHFNLVRPGIAIYGGLKDAGSSRPFPGFKQAMTFSSRIIHIKNLPKGACISYGHSFRASRDIDVALVPVGYDNGYLRRLSNRAEVIVGGKRCPVLGNVCMKTIMVDVSHVPGCQTGDEVILMGSQGKESVSAVELAERASTISYELFCLMGKLNQRVFL